MESDIFVGNNNAHKEDNRPIHFFQIFSLCNLLLCTAHFASAQKSVTKSEYLLNDAILDIKFNEQHIPVIGDSVHMIPFREGQKFGFTRKAAPGRFIVKPEFDHVYAVYKEGAIAGNASTYGLLDTHGKWVVKPVFTNLYKEQQMFHGVRKVKVSDRKAPRKYRSAIWNEYYTGDGRLMFKVRAHDQRSFSGSDSICWFRYGPQISIYSNTGKLVLKFSNAADQEFVGICNNLIIYRSKISKTASFDYIAKDIKNSIIFTWSSDNPNIDKIVRLSSGRIIIGDVDNYYYTSDSTGKYIWRVNVPKDQLFHPDFGLFLQSNLFVVEDLNTKLMGAINQSGAVAIELKYKYLGEFYNGMAYCKDINDKSFFIDASQNVHLEVTELISSEDFAYHLLVLKTAVGFSNGLCLGLNLIVKNKYHFFYFDKSGTIKLDMGNRLRMASMFSEGFAAAVDSTGLLGFINALGHFAIPAKYILAPESNSAKPYNHIPKFQGGYVYIDAIRGYVGRDGQEYFH